MVGIEEISSVPLGAVIKINLGDKMTSNDSNDTNTAGRNLLAKKPKISIETSDAHNSTKRRT